jgi:hypothetical protein
MTSSVQLSVAEHCQRSSHHCAVGDGLSLGEPGWAAVCFFYAAYHLARAALIADPVFSDPTRLSRINVELTPADRSTSRHNGRKKTANGREWGVNDLVGLLYRGFIGDYDRLHQASIDVRYHSGLRGDVHALRMNLETIQNGYAAGDFVSTA